MVANVITKMPLLNRLEFDQVGPQMKISGIWKTTVVRELVNNTVDVSPYPGTRRIIIDAREGGEIHQATIEIVQGRIVCRYCSVSGRACAWCTHIHHLARTHQDRILFDVNKAADFLIPVVPTDGVFVPVRIAPDENHKGFSRVFMELSDANDENSEPEEHAIGTLFSGFGLMELRSLVADFLDGWVWNQSYFMDISKALGMTPESFNRHTAARDEKVSAFATRYFCAATGMTLGHWEATQATLNDVPNF